jgi:hypothetical protein
MAQQNDFRSMALLKSTPYERRNGKNAREVPGGLLKTG